MILCTIVHYGFMTVLTCITTNIFTILLGAVVFLIVGSVWSIFRWWRYLIQIKNDLVEFKNKNSNISNQRELIIKFINYGKYSIISFPPKASNYKSEIAMWIVLWPLSMISYIFGELIVSIVKTIVNSLTGIYSRITVKVFEGFNVVE